MPRCVGLSLRKQARLYRRRSQCLLLGSGLALSLCRVSKLSRLGVLRPEFRAEVEFFASGAWSRSIACVVASLDSQFEETGPSQEDTPSMGGGQALAKKIMHAQLTQPASPSIFKSAPSLLIVGLAESLNY